MSHCLLPSTIQSIMGHLPDQRLQQGFTFMNTGVDYAGPFLSKDRKGCGARLSKSYIGFSDVYWWKDVI